MKIVNGKKLWHILRSVDIINLSEGFTTQHHSNLPKNWNIMLSSKITVNILNITIYGVQASLAEKNQKTTHLFNKFNFISKHSTEKILSTLMTPLPIPVHKIYPL